MVDELGLADNTGIGLSREILGEVLIVSKLDVAVQDGVEELIFAKIGLGEVKIAVLIGTLIVHSAVEVDVHDELPADTDGDSVNEGGCSSVNEVIDTCIVGTLS